MTSIVSLSTYIDKVCLSLKTYVEYNLLCKAIPADELKKKKQTSPVSDNTFKNNPPQ